MSAKGTKIVGGLAALLIVAVLGVYLIHAEGQEPRIEVQPADGSHVRGEANASITVTDRPSGLAEIEVRAIQEGEELIILELEPEEAPVTLSRTIAFEEMQLQEGDFDLQVSARDHSWANFFQGNRATLEMSYTYDDTPPRIDMESFRHNMQRGGSAAAAFRLEEKVSRTGVKVGERFFPAYEQDSGIHLAFFSYPHDIKAGSELPTVLAVDLAGNSREVPLRANVRETSFSSSEVRISEGFLERIMPQYRDDFPEVSGKAELFVAVNEELRRQNREELVRLGRETVTRPLWSERFLRLPGGSRQSGFGDKRSYLVKGEHRTSSVHTGIDLAATARAPIPASNSGRVVHAGWLGIYGETVVIDHGLGLQSLYGHMSQIDVRPGQQVERGEVIGRTGSTGLAGGDHLHFEILVSGVPVNPVEWWDSKWIENNIEPKLEAAGQEVKAE